MALTTPRAVFGLHSVTPYKISSGEFHGTIKVLSGSSLSLSGEQVKLTGGSNKYNWAVESGAVTAEMSWKLSEYPAFVFELLFGKAPAEVTDANASGEVNAFGNKKGTSIKSALNGVSGIAPIATSVGNLKFGHYVLKAVSSTKLEVYHSTDLEHAKGTAVEYLTDFLKVGEVTVAAGNNDLAALGLRLTGVGTPAFTIGDTAEFDVIPPYDRKLEVVLGGMTDSTPEFGCIVMAEKRGDGNIAAIDVFRCKAAMGMPIGFETKAFSSSEVKVDCLYSAEKNGVFKFISVKSTI